MKFYRFYTNNNEQNACIFFFSFLVTPILAAVGPESLGSDISIILHNDLLGEHEQNIKTTGCITLKRGR